MAIFSSLSGLIHDLTLYIISILKVSIIGLSILYRIGLINRAMQRLAEHLLSKEINGARVTMANLKVNFLTCEVEVADLIIHNLQRDDWQWDSPLLARAGKITCKLNILSCIDPIAAFLHLPCKDIYSVRVEDVQIFVEKRRNVFNFHLLDPSLDIPDPALVLASTKAAALQVDRERERVLVVENSSGLEGLETISSFDLELSDNETSHGNGSNPSVEEKANEIVTSMLGAVSSLGRAVNEGGKEGLEKALERQKMGFVNKLKQFQERSENSSGISPSSQRTQENEFGNSFQSSPNGSKQQIRSSMKTLAKEGMQVMKEMGKAVEKNVTQIQKHIDTYKKPPPKKKGWVKKVNNDIFRIGYVVLVDIRIFSKDLIVGNKVKAIDSSSSSTLNDSETKLISPKNGENNNTSAGGSWQPNAEGWSAPIWLKIVTITSADFCPPASMKGNLGPPSIGLKVDDLVDVFMKKMMAEIAKTNTGKVLRIAMGDVFNFIDLKKVNNGR